VSAAPGGTFRNPLIHVRHLYLNCSCQKRFLITIYELAVIYFILTEGLFFGAVEFLRASKHGWINLASLTGRRDAKYGDLSQQSPSMSVDKTRTNPGVYQTRRSWPSRYRAPWPTTHLPLIARYITHADIGIENTCINNIVLTAFDKQKWVIQHYHNQQFANSMTANLLGLYYYSQQSTTTTITTTTTTTILLLLILVFM